MRHAPGHRCFAILVDSLEGAYQCAVLRGIIDELIDKVSVMVVVSPALRQGLVDYGALTRNLPSPEDVDGVIVFSSAFEFAPTHVHAIVQFFQSTPQHHVNVCSIGVSCDSTLSIVTDDASGIRAAVGHLVRHHGLNNVAFLRGPDGNVEADRRLQAFQAAMLETGRFQSEYVAPVSDSSLRAAQRATERLLGAHPTIEGVIAANDEMALGALCAGERFTEGRRLAVIGFDDTEHVGAALTQLSTVRYPLEDAARLAARRMLLRSDRKLATEVIVLRTQIQIRESCGCRHPTLATASPLKAWICRLIPNKPTAITLLRYFRAAIASTDQCDRLEALTEQVLERRLANATSNDIPVWHQTLNQLRDATLRETLWGEPLKARLDQYWTRVLARVSRAGSLLARENEDWRIRLAEYRRELDSADTATLDTVRRQGLHRLGVLHHWECSNDNNTSSGNAVGTMNSPSPTDASNASRAGDHSGAMQLQVMYTLGRAPEPPEHLVFQLGPPREWWIYEELAGILAACKQRSASPAGHREHAPESVAGLPPREQSGDYTTRSFSELVLRAGALLDVFRSVVSFDSASVQIIQGDARYLFLARGFEEASVGRNFLRPLSVDPLVRNIIIRGEPLLVGDVSQLDGWNPSFHSQAWIGAPVFAGEEAVGFVTLDFRQLTPDINNYAHDVMRLTHQLAPYLVEARPALREQQLAERTMIVKQTIDRASQSLDPTALLSTVADQVAQHLNCNCTIFLSRVVDGHLSLVAEHDSVPLLKKRRRFAPGEGIAGWVFETGHSLLLHDVCSDHRFARATNPTRERSMVAVPIKVAGQMLGVICADQDSLGWFRTDDVGLIEALAQQVGVSIQLSSAFQSLQEIATGILSSTSSREILTKVVERAIAVTNADSGVIYLLSEDRQSIKETFHPPGFTHPTPRLDDANSATARIILQGKLVALHTPSGTSDAAPELGTVFRSLVGVPLVINDRVLGALIVNSRESRWFSDTERSLLTILASQAAIALQKPQQYPQRPRRSCFVIMPFSANSHGTAEDWTYLFESCIKPAVEQSGRFECRRSESVVGDVLAQVVHNLKTADVVLADLTDRNANVFHELGIRDTLGGATILIAQEERDIVFNLSQTARIIYDRSTAGLVKLQHQLVETVAHVDAQLSQNTGKNLVSRVHSIIERIDSESSTPVGRR